MLRISGEAGLSMGRERAHDEEEEERMLTEEAQGGPLMA